MTTNNMLFGAMFFMIGFAAGACIIYIIAFREKRLLEKAFKAIEDAANNFSEVLFSAAIIRTETIGLAVAAAWDIKTFFPSTVTQTGTIDIPKRVAELLRSEIDVQYMNNWVVNDAHATTCQWSYEALKEKLFFKKYSEVYAHIFDAELFEWLMNEKFEVFRLKKAA